MVETIVDMDETTASSSPPARAEGFEHQRLCVVPRPLVDAALGRSITQRLTVTDAGFFPAARGHHRVRPSGIPETIVLVCTAGSGSVVIDGREHTLTPSTTITIPAGRPHEYRASASSPWTIWWMHARGADAAHAAAARTADSSPVRRLRTLDRMVALFDELVGLLEHRLSPVRLEAASGVALHLLTRLAADSVLPEEDSPLERAMRYLEARTEGDITVTELAALVSVSPSHLGALFRRATGSGPGAFHTSLKMARARDLLDTTVMPVAEVAASVGYADPLYFSRHFRRVHGVSPTAYRAQRKG
jgi:AraC-like DNA-binding protein